MIRTWSGRNENSRHKSNPSQTVPLPPQSVVIDDAASPANASQTVRRLQIRRQESRGVVLSSLCPNDVNSWKI